MFKIIGRIIKWAFLCIVILTVIVIYQMSEEAGKKKESAFNLIERAKTDSNLAIKATPFEIWSLDKQNKFAGDEKYKDKLISVKGQIKDIDAVFSTPVLELDASSNLLNIYATLYLDFEGDQKELSAILSKLARAQSIRVLCYGKGGLRLKCYSNSFY